MNGSGNPGSDLLVSASRLLYRQISGRKQWAIYYENELVRAVSDFEHGANYRSNLVYYGATEPGDVLVFYPWAAHAAKVSIISTNRRNTVCV